MTDCDFITTTVSGRVYYCHREIVKHGRCRWHQIHWWDRSPFIQFLKEFFS